MFLYAHENKEKLGLKRVIWITRSDEIHSEWKEKGYEVYKCWSFKSIWYHIRGKYHFVDQSIRYDLNSFFSIWANKINLWHGFPLKKVGTYAGHLNKEAVSFGGWHKSKVLGTSEFASEIQGIAFGKSQEDIITGMYPRNDYLLNRDYTVSVSEDKVVKKVKKLKEEGKKIIFYLPTFRDNREIDFLGVKKEEEREVFFDILTDNGYVFITKLHFAGKMFHSENLETKAGKYINLPQEVDVYPIIKETDILITDYSSIYFDFLYLNRDIIFYPYDLDYYKNEDRGLIFDYDEMTPGNKVYSLKELKSDLLNKRYKRDNYAEDRKKLKEKIFSNYTIEDTIKEISKIGG